MGHDARLSRRQFLGMVTASGALLGLPSSALPVDAPRVGIARHPGLLAEVLAEIADA